MSGAVPGYVHISQRGRAAKRQAVQPHRPAAPAATLRPMTFSAGDSSAHKNAQENEARGFVLYVGLNEELAAANGTSLVRIVAESPVMSGQALAAQVSTEETYVVEPLGEFEGAKPRARVVAVDLGIKSRTPYHLAARGARVYVVPSTASFADIESLNPDGVFFSNGPGDPSTADREVDVLRAVLDAGIPYFGICFGHQLFGRALGYGTYKLNYGHRGINQPVKDLETGRVEITAHNHGFAVDAPVGSESVAPFDAGRYGRITVSHVGLNDGVVEGLRALDIPAFSVQYHPEAAAGPHDGELLFDRFMSLMIAAKENR